MPVKWKQTDKHTKKNNLEKKVVSKDTKMPSEKSGSYAPVAQGEKKIAQMEIEDNDSVGLKPTLGLIQGCNVIIGCIIGSGIFIAPGGGLLGRIKAHPPPAPIVPTN